LPQRLCKAAAGTGAATIPEEILADLSLEQLSNVEVHPEVLLLDIGMPGLNGYEVARRIRQLAWGASVVLVAVTGWGQEEDRIQTSVTTRKSRSCAPLL
jgi:CheY-like chemotaxis protein